MSVNLSDQLFSRSQSHHMMLKTVACTGRARVHGQWESTGPTNQLWYPQLKLKLLVAIQIKMLLEQSSLYLPMTTQFYVYLHFTFKSFSVGHVHKPTH